MIALLKKLLAMLQMSMNVVMSYGKFALVKILLLHGIVCLKLLTLLL